VCVFEYIIIHIHVSSSLMPLFDMRVSNTGLICVCIISVYTNTSGVVYILYVYMCVYF